jgi:hypothetical protein
MFLQERRLQTVLSESWEREEREIMIRLES